MNTQIEIDLLITFTGMSDEKKQAYSTDTIHSFERDGDSIKNQVQLESGMIFKSAFQLNVEREWKDKDNDPDFQVKVSFVSSLDKHNFQRKIINMILPNPSLLKYVLGVQNKRLIENVSQHE